MASELIDRLKIVEAVEALKLYAAKASKQKKNLLNPVESENIHLQFSCKKVSIARKNIKMLLPHSFVDANNSICLFVRDDDRENRDYTVTIDNIRQLLDKAGVTQSIEIMPLKQLKLEYKEFESKRNLLAMYDIFLADERIVRLLPPQLGKEFYNRKRFPIPVSLTRQQHMKQEIYQALRTAQCILTGRGCSSQVTIGRMSQKTDEIVDNIVEAVQHISSSLPGGQLNIRSVLVKAQDTPSVPIFVSLGLKDDVQLTLDKHRPAAPEPEEVTTVARGKVLVTANCNVKIVGGKSSTVQVKPDARGGRNKKITTAATKTEANESIPTLVPAAAAAAAAELSSLMETKIEVKEEIEEQSCTEKQKNSKKPAKRKHKQTVDQTELIECKIEASDANKVSSDLQKTKASASKAKNKKSVANQKLSSNDAARVENGRGGRTKKQPPVPKVAENKKQLAKTKPTKSNTVGEPARKKQKLHP